MKYWDIGYLFARLFCLFGKQDRIFYFWNPKVLSFLPYNYYFLLSIPLVMLSALKKGYQYLRLFLLLSYINIKAAMYFV